MPVYEYVCDQCGHETEALRKMAEADAPITCEACGSERTRRAHSVFTAAATTGTRGTSLPMGAPAGGCCPCGKAPGTPGACGMP